jgi:hypothetical protein
MNRIIRVKSDKGFTVINNSVFTSGLSLRSIGLLSYILHLPDDWVLYKSWLYDNMPCDGRESINTAWTQLIQKGFIVAERSKGGGRGKLPEINYKVYDRPVKNADLSIAENPSTDNQQVIASNSLKNVDFPLTNNPQRKHPLRKTRQLLSTNVLSTNKPNTDKSNTNTVLVPSGTDPSPTINLVEELPNQTERLPNGDEIEATKKEHARYETEIVPYLRKIDHVAQKIKIADYIREKKPTFYEPYKDLWNLSASGNGLSVVKKLSDGRLKKFKTRLKDPDFDFIAIMMGIKKSAMLRGDNARGWKVDWDFVFENDTNYLKIIEGKYQ